MSKTQITKEFKSAVCKLSEEVAPKFRPALKQVEKAFADLRHHSSNVQRHLDEQAGALAAVEKECLAATEKARVAKERAESLTQKLATKDAEVARLTDAIGRTQSMLARQQEKGFDAEMIGDFLRLLYLDVQHFIEDHTKPALKPEPTPEHKFLIRKYGQLSAFLPASQLAWPMGDDPAEAARQWEYMLLEKYTAELAHLDALQERLAFALERCRKPKEAITHKTVAGKDGPQIEVRTIPVEKLCSYY